MAYRSGMEFRSGGLAPYIGALIPASIASSFIGMVLLAIWAVVTAGPVEVTGPLELALVIAAAGLGLGLAIVLGSFVVAFYLSLLGLPVALLLGRYLHYPWALAIALVDAAGSAFLVATGTRLGIFGNDSFSLPAFLMILGFALPAGYLYRRSVIALRDEAELAY